MKILFFPLFLLITFLFGCGETVSPDTQEDKIQIPVRDPSDDVPSPNNPIEPKGYECSLGYSENGKNSSEEIPRSNEISMARIFLLDPNKTSISIEVYGIAMMTFDGGIIDDYLKKKESLGVLDGCKILGVGIEGGGHYCITVKDGGDRLTTIEELQNIKTHHMTRYIVQSVDSCANAAPYTY